MSKGVVRKFDRLGRIVIPIEYRRMLGISENGKDAAEIRVVGDTIIVSKYRIGCQICDKKSEIVEFKGVVMCKDCLCKMFNDAPVK